MKGNEKCDAFHITVNTDQNEERNDTHSPYIKERSYQSLQGPMSSSAHMS